MANERKVLEMLVRGEIKTEEQRDEALALLAKSEPKTSASAPVVKGPAKK